MGKAGTFGRQTLGLLRNRIQLSKHLVVARLLSALKSYCHKNMSK